MNRKNLGIPPDIHRAYKLYAAAHNTTIVELAVKALLQYATEHGITTSRKSA